MTVNSRTKRMDERSDGEIIRQFLIISPLFGLGILAFVLTYAIRHVATLTAGEWFWQVGWAALLGLGLMTALPAVGWQELRKRRNSLQSNPARIQNQPD